MLELRIARRFLWRSKVQSLLIILGIAVGLAVQVFVGSLITSLQASLIDETVGSSPQVSLEPADGQVDLTFTAQDRTTLAADARITSVAPVQDLVCAPEGGGRQRAGGRQGGHVRRYRLDLRPVSEGGGRAGDVERRSHRGRQGVGRAERPHPGGRCAAGLSRRFDGRRRCLKGCSTWELRPPTNARCSRGWSWRALPSAGRSTKSVPWRCR